MTSSAQLGLQKSSLNPSLVNCGDKFQNISKRMKDCCCSKILIVISIAFQFCFAFFRNPMLVKLLDVPKDTQIPVRCGNMSKLCTVMSSMPVKGIRAMTIIRIIRIEVQAVSKKIIQILPEHHIAYQLSNLR